jgi:ELWxxDGT repeat protein
MTPTAAGLLFRACQQATGCELWRSDGTTDGTGLVADVAPGIASSFPNDIAVVGARAFFEASDGQRGREVWEFDPTTGTVRVRDFRLGEGGSDVGFPEVPTAVGSTLFFPRDDGETGVELWSLEVGASIAGGGATP